MRLAAAVLLVFVSGCASTSLAASAPSGSPSRPGTPGSATASPGSASPSPRPSATAAAVYKLSPPVTPPAAPSGRCNLPVYWPGPGQGSLKAGFVLYPGGTPTGPALTISADGDAFYDRAVNRWLPVPADAVSSDGLRFAYAEYDVPPTPAAGMATSGGPHGAGLLATTGRVHVVDARTGADQVVYSGAPTYVVVGFESDGLYLAQVGITMDGNFSSGLYLLRAGGTPTPVLGGDRPLDRTGWRIGRGSAWGSDFSSQGGITGGNELVQLDLHSGAVTVWLTKPLGTQVSLVGFDPAGSPLVTAYANGYSPDGSPAPSPPSQLLALSSPSKAAVVYQSADPSLSLPYGPSFVDGNGAWLSGEPGQLWLDQGGTMSILAIVINAPISVGNTCA